MNKYPILNPYPIFGQDEYAYMHTLIRYNTIKAGYDASIYSARFPDYLHAGDIGPQAKVKHSGKYEKYTSLILDDDKELLAFQISIPVRVEFKAKIQAMLLPLDDDEGLITPVPVAWSSEEYTKINGDDKTTFKLNYATATEEKIAEYFIADVDISNIYDAANPFHKAWCGAATKVELKNSEEAAVMEAPKFLQKVIEPKNGVSKTFVLRVFLTVRDKITNALMDQRDDSIIIDILPNKNTPPTA